MIIDSHCHLDDPKLYDQLDNVVNRAEKKNIKYFLTICTTIPSFRKIEIIVKKYSNIYGTFGIHPHEAENDIVSKNTIIDNIKKSDKIIGVGETGLDFFYNHSNKEKQISSFKSHIEASIDLNLPLIVHSRNAENETYEILNEYKKKQPKILMHCFTGSKSFAKKLFDLNSYFSASGIITFKNSIELQETFKIIPLNRLLIETDSPFLAPEPYRGKKNEPSFVKFTAEKLANLKKVDTQELIKTTTLNFKTLFN